MGETLGVETVTCRHCHAVYVATVKVNGATAGSQTCEVCGEVALIWNGARSYSDFHLVHRPTNWNPARASGPSNHWASVQSGSLSAA